MGFFDAFNRNNIGNTLTLLSGAMRDIGNPDSNGEGMANAQAMLINRQKMALAQQQMQARQALYNDIIGQSSGGVSGGSGPRSLQDAAPALLRANAAGVDITDAVSVLDKLQPNIQNANGLLFNSKDPSMAGRFVPSFDKGQAPVMQGNDVVGVRNLPGSVQSAADMAGAVAGAQEGAKAGLDLVDIPMPDGSSYKAPRDVAAALMRQSALGAPAPVGFGRTQTPADKAAAEVTARTGAERAAEAPKVFSGLQQQAATTDMVIDSLSKILGVKVQPDGTLKPNGQSMVSGMTTGFGANMASIAGTPAYNLKAALAPIISNIGFDKLQDMRANSPTGGALGSLAVEENKMLQATAGSLDIGQSPEKFAQSAAGVLQQLVRMRAQRQQAYDAVYGSGRQQPSRPAARPSRTDVEAEMRRRGLLR